MSCEELTAHLALAVLIASFGSAFQHGYNVGDLNAPAHLLRSWIAERHLENYGTQLPPATLVLVSSIASSVFNFGGIIGGVFGTALFQKMGLDLKAALIYNNVLIFVGSSMEFSSKYVGYYEVMIVGRLIIGMNAGVNTAICVLYLCDLAPVRIRGAMGSTYQLCLVLSTLLAAIIGTDLVLGRKETWHYMLAFPIIPAVIQFVVLWFMPDSPRWLFIIKDDLEGTVEVLKWLRSSANVDEEISSMRQEKQAFEYFAVLHISDFCRLPQLRNPLIICSLIMAAQQLSGFAALSFSSNQIIVKQEHLSHATLQYANIGYNCLNVAFTLISTVYLIEKCGRRTSLLASFIGITLAHSSLMVCIILHTKAIWVPYVSVFFVYLYIVSYALGAGPIPWFLVSEMFSQRAKPIAQSIVVGIHWSANFIVAISFAPLVNSIGYYVYLVFITICLFIFFFILLYVPVTKDKTVQEVHVGSNFSQRSLFRSNSRVARGVLIH